MNSKALKKLLLTVYTMTEASGRTERIKQKKLIGINVKSYIWAQKMSRTNTGYGRFDLIPNI